MIWLTSALHFGCYYAPFAVAEWALGYSVEEPSRRRWWPRFLFLVFARIALVALLSIFVFPQIWQLDFAWTLIGREFWRQVPEPICLLAAILVYSFFYYWAHRFLHGIQFFWRSHQMHHSPDRFDLSLSVYSHPIDFLVIVASLCLAILICGFPLSYFAVLGIGDEVISRWLHLRIRTPRWMGNFFFRPEQHGLHHATHDINFGIIPLWDQVFGTFENPRVAPEKFGLAAEAQFWPMFFLKKLS